MQKVRFKYYPTTLEATHLLVLYIFLQSLFDFPLAMYDYQKDTNWLANPWISFITNMGVTAFIFVFGFKKTQSSFKQVFAVKSFNPLLIIPIFFLLPAMQYLVGLLNAKVDEFLPAPPWFWELFERIFENRFGFWGAAFKVVILAPVIEETLFRGIIMHGLMRNYKSWYAILLSGLMFSIFHLNPWQMTYTFFLGLLLGWVMVKTRSLPFAILVHALNNLIVLLSITFQYKIDELALFNMPAPKNLYVSCLAICTGILLFVAFSMKKSKTAKPKI